MAGTETQNAEMLCEHCGERFRYDEGRRCWTCDTLVCPACMNEPPGRLCPECRSRSETMPQSVEPMLARLGTLPERSDGWGFEFKWDGVRAITYWDGSRIRIESRTLANVTFRYPELHDLGQSLRADAILDGEIVALDEHGGPSFPLLQQRMHVDKPSSLRARAHIRIHYYVFDLLYFDGATLFDESYDRRRVMLEELGIQHGSCRVPPSHRGEGREILDVARKHGLEGIMCKRLDSLYLPGRRSDDWRKVKVVNSREFVIGGFKYGVQGRDKVGSLQLGAYDSDMRLRFVGGVGTGFGGPDHQILLSRLEPIRREQNPFDDEIDRKDVVFVAPRYVAEIEYRRWPAGGQIQQAAYKGLRADKSAGDVTLEEP